MEENSVVAGRYAIEALVGSGGMGSVYRARHLITNKRVALKVLHEGSPDMRLRVVREARAACAVEHENVVAIHDVLEADDGSPILVMDLLQGESLRERLRSRGQLTEEEALAIVAPIVGALRAAHERGIVHRDLKPENVFLTTAGGVKVLDFGIAKVMGDTESANLTRTGTVLGTLLYMAPEQAFGDPFDHRVDVWAIGVMAYEMLTGRRPIEGETTGAILRSLSNPDIQPLIARRPDASKAFAALTDRMLRATPAARPSLDEIALALEAAGHRVPAAAAFPRARSSGSKSPVGPADAGLADTEFATPRDLTLSPNAAWSGAFAPTAIAAPRIEQPALPLRSRRWVFLLAIGAAGVAGLVAVGIQQAKARLHNASSVPVSASSSAPADSPVSTVATAVRAYGEGVAALHRSEWESATAAFDRALAADPECAAAAVQRLIMARWMNNTPGDLSPESYGKLYRLADHNRARLSPRDTAFLDASEAWVTRDPPDGAEMQRRLDAAAAVFPGDAETLFIDGLAHEGDVAVQLRLMDAALAIDPTYVDAMQSRARSLGRLGRGADALAELDACVRTSPAADCAGDRINRLSELGQCAAAERAARDYVAAAGSSTAYRFQVRALINNDAPQEAVDEAVKQYRQKLGDRQAYLADGLSIAAEVVRGRLRSALTRARDNESAIDGRAEVEPHDTAALYVVELLGELGTAVEVSAYANRFAARRRAWSRDPNATDPEISMLFALDRTGALAHNEVLRRGHAWVDAATRFGRDVDFSASHAAVLASTLEEARSFGDYDLPRDAVMFAAVSQWAYLGHRDLVVGRLADAIDRLRATTRACHFAVDPFTTVQAHLWLGEALEQQHDKSGACAEYGAVLARWSNEQPLGRTAADADKRAKALGCK